jgi:hypothetical protein
MAACVMQLQVANGPSGSITYASGESGFKYNREDTISGTTAVPIPTALGTRYSWLKWLCLSVTTVGTTNISNRRIQLAGSAMPGGTAIFFQGNATYAQAATGNMPPDNTTSNGPALPSGFTLASTSTQLYDGATVSSGSLGKNGNYCETVFGVDFTYTTPGAGSNVGLSDVRLIYDEGP